MTRLAIVLGPRTETLKGAIYLGALNIHCLSNLIIFIFYNLHFRLFPNSIGCATV